MSLKHPVIVITAAAVCAVVLGSASASARENCGLMYQRVMEAYQTQSPRYSHMLNHYSANCLSGSSQPAWGTEYRQPHDYRGGYGDQRHSQRYDYRGGYGDQRHWGW